MISSTRPRFNYPLDFIETLRNWANSSRAEKDLETVFGQALHWPTAYRHILALQGGDISLLPDVKILPASAMPGLWGGYSRGLQLVFLSADCPQDLIVPVLLEEIGHFFDQQLCNKETPGDEGAVFSALVLGLAMNSLEAADDALRELNYSGAAILVEAAPKVRGSRKIGRSSGKSGRKKRGSSPGGGSNSGSSPGYAEVGGGSSNPKLQQSIIYATEEGARIPQNAVGDRLIGSRGNDTFVVFSQNVKIEDPMDGTDTVESTGTFSLANHSLVENLVLTGTGDTSGTGNLSANKIFGNAGNNFLDGGDDSSVDTLYGSYGNDTYFVRDTLDQIVEGGQAGDDFIFTELSDFSASLYANVEGIAYVGSLTSGVTYYGNNLDNTILGSSGSDSIDGGVGMDTMVGGLGDDTYIVDNIYDLPIEAEKQGIDTVISTVSQYALKKHLEVLRLGGGLDISGIGNQSDNSIYGNSGKNSLDGGGGSDTLQGGGGADTYIGGGGNDFFVVKDQVSIVEDADSVKGGIDTAITHMNFTLQGGVENMTMALAIEPSGTSTAGTEADVANNSSTTGQIFTGSPLVSEIDYYGDSDLYKVDFLAGTTYEIRMLGTPSQGGALDTPQIVGVYYGNLTTPLPGTTDAWDYYRGVHHWVPTIRFTVQNTGTHYIRVNGWSFYSTGTYTLEVNGVSNLRGVGNNLENTLTGNDGNNYLSGLDGGDLLLGAGGRDTLDGGIGDDTLNGGGFDVVADILQGGVGNDVYVVDSVIDQIVDFVGGKDRVLSSVSYDLSSTLVSGIEVLELIGVDSISGIGDAFSNTLIGNIGNNSLNGAGEQDTVLGGAGDDTLHGGILDGKKDSLIGGDGDDIYIIDSDIDKIFEKDGEGTDTIETTSSINLQNLSGVSDSTELSIENIVLSQKLIGIDRNINATGNAIANSLVGNKGNNILDGGEDAISDTLIGNGGNDIFKGGRLGVGDYLWGGEDDDTYDVESDKDYINEDGGIDIVKSSVSFDLSAQNVSGLEHLIYSGSDSARLTGNEADNSLISQSASSDELDGGSGNDTLDGGGGVDIFTGGDGDDFFIIDNEADVIVELDDELSGFDTALIQSRNADEKAKYALEVNSNVENLLYLGTSESSLEGSRFDNRIQGSNNQNTLLGHDGNDYLIGGALADSLIGGKGNDTLDGKMGTDILDGGEGNDLYFVNFQSAKIEDAAGTDTVRSTATYSLNYNGGLSRIEGLELLGSANINATGNSLTNTLVGNDGSNQIDANEGNDTVLGGLGADFLQGGSGNDSMIGGGNPQGDLPADASTPISIVSGQAYTGFIESRQDTDWIKVTLSQGIKYSFSLKRVLDGPTALKRNSDIAFGVPWDNEGIIWNFPEQVLFDKEGNKAYGDFENLSSDDSSLTGYSKQFGNIYSFEFTPYDSGEFYVPIAGSGPALGSYTVTVEDSSISGVNLPSFADTASNTLVGGLGSDTLISGNGRDEQGNALGDLLLGGTNGMFGSFDSDTEDDTLIGGDGADTLDGGLGNNSLIGGNGNDHYFTRSRGDIIREKVIGGTADIVVVGFSDASSGWDIDLDLENYKYIEGVTLQGGADLRVIGNDVANTIVGNLGDNSMSGAGGDDSLLGAGGNDTLDGAEGDDYLDGGSGVNSMIGGLGRDTYIINDRNDRVIETVGGISGGVDFIHTYFNFDPIQGTALEQFQPDVADNSPSVTKSPSFASKDLNSFYKLENFELLGEAAYGVGNALGNSLIAGKSAALLLGMGGEDSLIGNIGSDSLFGDTPDFYADPDLYAPTPTNTRTSEFISGVIGVYGSDYLSGGAGDDYLDGGKGFDTMAGGAGSNVFVQDHTDDYINAAGGSGNELISSVNIASIPDNISRIMLVVKEQERIGGKSITGQEQVASFASFLGSKGGNDQAGRISVGGVSFGVEDANILEQLYGTAKAEVFSNLNDQDRQDKGHLRISVSPKFADPNDNAKVAYDLSWAAIDSGDHAEQDPIIGYNISYRERGSDHWLTYVDGSSQDLQGTTANPSLTIYNLDPDKTYEFLAEGRRRSVPVTRDPNGNATGQLVATLQGGAGNDQVSSVRLIRGLGLHGDANLDPYIWNNILDPLPSAFLFAPLPVKAAIGTRQGYATYLDGGFGNDLLCGWEVNDASGLDYELSIKQWSETGVTAATEKIMFRGLNTLVGGQGSDTFIVRNGGQAIGDEFDWVIKYGNETPVDYGSGGIGNSLNGGQHNVVASAVKFLTLSDTEVHQGMFIDQLALASVAQFGMGNRLDNYIYDGSWSPSAGNTLVGAGGRDSIVGNSSMDVLIGGNAYGLDNVGFSIKDFASVADGGNGLLTSIFRDTDPIPVQPNASGAADLSQFWSMPGFYKYGEVFDLNKNRDTLVGFATGDNGLTLDGGAGSDSMVGSSKADTFYVSNLIEHPLSGFLKGNGGGDTVIFTDSDYLWWTGHKEGGLLMQNSYSLDKTDLSNLTLQMGAPTARKATGNDTANLIIGNEFDNTLDGTGVGASGIDTLVGDGLVDVNLDEKIDAADMRGNLSSDNFIVKDYYRKSTTWKPAVVTTDISTKVETIDPITGVKTTTTIPLFQHDWNNASSTYLDDDFVVIRDFKAITDFINPITGVRTSGGGNPDNLELKDNLSSYSIGNLPTSIESKNLGKIKVGPQGQDITGGEFGIYYTGNQEKWGSGEEAAPNLVAVIQSLGSLLLDRDGDGVFNAALDLVKRPSFSVSSDTTNSAVPNPLMGWGQFYQLDTSNFAQYINQPYFLATSNADLSVLMNQIV